MFSSVAGRCSEERNEFALVDSQVEAADLTELEIPAQGERPERDFGPIGRIAPPPDAVRRQEDESVLLTRPPVPFEVLLKLLTGMIPGAGQVLFPLDDHRVGLAVCPARSELPAPGNVRDDALGTERHGGDELLCAGIPRERRGQILKEPLLLRLFGVCLSQVVVQALGVGWIENTRS